MGMARSWVGDRAVAGRDLPLGVWGGSPASADRRALRRQTKVLVFPRAGLQPAGRVAMVLLSVRRRNQERTTTGWECGNLAVSIAEGNSVVGRSLAKRSPRSPTLRGEHCGRRRGLSRRRSAERAVRKLPQQVARDHDMERGDRVGIMPFGADAATLAGGSPAAAPGLIVQHGRRGLRGKNGSAR